MWDVTFAPLLQAGLHPDAVVVGGSLGAGVFLVEPECGTEGAAVAFVAEPGGHQSPGQLRRDRFAVVVGHVRQHGGGDLGEIVGLVSPPLVDGYSRGDLGGHVLDGGVVRGRDDHLESG